MINQIWKNFSRFTKLRTKSVVISASSTWSTSRTDSVRHNFDEDTKISRVIKRKKSNTETRVMKIEI
ncbi:hypothetical protein LguiA_011161 [Lonicera macranthoides]